MGGVSSKVDPSLFLWYNKNNTPIGYILVPCWWFLICWDTSFPQKEWFQSWNKNFQAKEEVKLDFKYIRLNVITIKFHISADQYHYINNLRKIYIASGRKSNNFSLLISCEKDQLRAKIGQFIWISNQTRPEINFDVTNLASTLGNAIIEGI